MTAAVPACIGKLPIHADFVRANHGQVPEVLELDQWLLAGMERGYEVRGRAFEAELRALPPTALLYQSPRSGRVLAGALLPSQDRVGRVYPFLIGYGLDDPTPGPGFDRLPLAVHGALRAAGELAGGDLAGVALAAFQERVLGLCPEVDENRAEQALRSYLFGTTLDQLWADWPAFAAPARRARFLRELQAVTAAPFPPRYVVSLPVGGAPEEVAFWLTLLRQWLPVRRNPTLMAWPLVPGPVPRDLERGQTRQAGDHGRLRLLFDDPHPRYCAPLLWPGDDTQHLLDLLRVRPDASAPSGAPPALLRPRALLQDVILAAARGQGAAGPP